MTRQYIGARYVIKCYENSQDPSSAEWEAGTSYEALVLVTYNNSSYLSKKPVPATVGDPAANPAYWVVTGAYNGQIASLQAQIDTLNDIVSDMRVFTTPEEFGAVGDGVADDSQAIQDAINAGKGLVIFSQTYRVVSPITLASNLTLQGIGGKIIEDVPQLLPYKGVFEGASLENIVIDGLTVEGPNVTGATQYTTNTIDSFINISDSEHIIVRNCSFTGLSKANTIIFQGCDDVLVEHNTIKYYLYCAIGFYDTTSHARAVHNDISNCRYVPVDQGNSYGIVLSGYTSTTYTPGSYLRASGNTLVNDTHMWEGIDAHGGFNIEVDNNTIEGYQFAISTFANPDITPAFYLARLSIHDNIIEGYNGPNAFNNPSGSGAITASGYGVSIANNIIDNCGRYIGASGAENYFGIRIFKYATGIEITGNAINNQGGSGIIFEVGSMSVAGTINNNTIAIGYAVDGDKYSIYMYDSNKYQTLVFRENQFIGDTHLRFTATTPNAGFINLENNDYSQAILTQINVANVIPDMCLTTEIASILRGFVGKIVRCQDATAAGTKLWVCTSVSPVTYTAMV